MPISFFRRYLAFEVFQEREESWQFPISFYRRVSRFKGFPTSGTLLFCPCSHKNAAAHMCLAKRFVKPTVQQLSCLFFHQKEAEFIMDRGTAWGFSIGSHTTCESGPFLGMMWPGHC